MRHRPAPGKTSHPPRSRCLESPSHLWCLERLSREQNSRLVEQVAIWASGHFDDEPDTELPHDESHSGVQPCPPSLRNYWPVRSLMRCVTIAFPLARAAKPNRVALHVGSSWMYEVSGG